MSDLSNNPIVRLVDIVTYNDNGTATYKFEDDDDGDVEVTTRYTSVIGEIPNIDSFPMALLLTPINTGVLAYAEGEGIIIPLSLATLLDFTRNGVEFFDDLFNQNMQLLQDTIALIKATLSVDKDVITTMTTALTILTTTAYPTPPMLATQIAELNQALVDNAQVDTDTDLVDTDVTDLLTDYDTFKGV